MRLGGRRPSYALVCRLHTPKPGICSIFWKLTMNEFLALMAQKNQQYFLIKLWVMPAVPRPHL